MPASIPPSKLTRAHIHTHLHADKHSLGYLSAYLLDIHDIQDLQVPLHYTQYLHLGHSVYHVHTRHAVNTRHTRHALHATDRDRQRQTDTHAHIHLCMPICMYACMYVCVYGYIYYMCVHATIMMRGHTCIQAYTYRDTVIGEPWSSSVWAPYIKRLDGA